jgi:5'-methylthioadenosine phosphorylase
MKQLGVAWILSVSAVGSLQKRYRPRDIVLPDQFLDRTKQSAAHTFFGRGIVAHISFAEPICHELRAILYDAARAEKARVHNGGTYVCMEGPAFSTRAESLLNHRSGGAVIGMTNLGEAKCAREAEIAYANLALVTDYDCWNPDEEHVSLSVILDNLHHNAEMARAIIARAIPEIPRLPGCKCHRALEHAIFTDRSLWPAKTVRELRPLLARFLQTAQKKKK